MGESFFFYGGKSSFLSKCVATWLLAGRQFGEPALSYPAYLAHPPLSPLSNVYTDLVNRRSVLLGGVCLRLLPLRDFPLPSVIHLLRDSPCLRLFIRERITKVELTYPGRVSKPAGSGAYSEWTALHNLHAALPSH